MDELARRRCLERQRLAESRGRVADSLAVRMSIVARIESGEISLAEGQAELGRIKRTAKSAGKITRNQAFLGR